MSGTSRGCSVRPCNRPMPRFPARPKAESCAAAHTDARYWAIARATSYWARPRSGRLLSAKRSRARDSAARGGDLGAGGWGCARASTRMGSSGAARAYECVRGITIAPGRRRV